MPDIKIPETPVSRLSFITVVIYIIQSKSRFCGRLINHGWTSALAGRRSPIGQPPRFVAPRNIPGGCGRHWGRSAYRRECLRRSRGTIYPGTTEVSLKVFSLLSSCHYFAPYVLRQRLLPDNRDKGSLCRPGVLEAQPAAGSPDKDPARTNPRRGLRS